MGDGRGVSEKPLFLGRAPNRTGGGIHRDWLRIDQVGTAQIHWPDKSRVTWHTLVRSMHGICPAADLIPRVESTTSVSLVEEVGGRRRGREERREERGEESS